MGEEEILRLRLNQDSRYIIFSDCHRGCGSGGDDFAKNSLLYKCAMEYYLNEGWTYIELGDAEELWENKDFKMILIAHRSIYELLQRFHDPDPERTRYIKIYGNHDIIWKRNPSPLREIFPNIRLNSRIIIEAKAKRFFLFHGHQVDPVCRGYRARFSKFIVRHIWRRFQSIGFPDPTRAAENPGLSDRIDDRLFNMSFPASIIIAGHTHRPVFSNLTLTEKRLIETGNADLRILEKQRSAPRYFNTGSCVHPRCITGIELIGSQPKLRLIKWHVSAKSLKRDSFSLSIERKVLEERDLN